MKTINNKGNRIFGHPYATKQIQNLVDKICFGLLEKNILINGNNPLSNMVSLTAHIGNKENLINDLKKYSFKFETEGEWLGEHYVKLKHKETTLRIAFCSNRVKLYVPTLKVESMEDVFKRTYAQTFKQSSKGILQIYK